MKLKGLFIFLFICLTGQVHAGTFSITSAPARADIYVEGIGKNGQGFSKKLGQTPFKIDIESAISSYTKGTNFTVVIRKEGYQDYRVLVGHPGFGDLNLKAALIADSSVKEGRKLDRLINDLFDVQRLIRDGDSTGAIAKLERLQKDFPHISTIYEMKAMSYYIKKDKRRSLASYREAFRVNPKNEDVFKMKTLLEQELGISK